MGERVSSISYATLVELLRSRAAAQPHQNAYTFLRDDEIDEPVLTHAELDKQAQSLASLLQSIASPGERALLLYPPGLEFIVAFFGCLYAGLIAVPLPPPRTKRAHDPTWARLLGIVRDAEPALTLTTSQFLTNAEGLVGSTPELPRMHWLATDNLSQTDVASWKPPDLNSSSIGYLQYTSGSTSFPKGVIVSHENALSNLAQIARSLEDPRDSVGITWLPHYHDMGLVGGILYSLFLGSQHFLMSPASFLQQPIRWLSAISKLRITRSGGPNFAYDLCVRRTTPAQRASLDLSSWRVAYNGAEPPRKETLEAFARAFEPCGFQFEAFVPSYGLAEATLKVTARTRSKPLTFCVVDAAALGRNQVRETNAEQPNTLTVVSSGLIDFDTKVVTVKQGTSTPCAAGEVGEIWVSGPSVAKGYWNRSEETAATFQAHLAETGEGPFLRTGDLGFIKDEEVFVTGRLKDLIIIRGHNHYPSDIEITVAASHPDLSPGGCAAFSVDFDGEEQLVIAQEVERKALRGLDTEEVVRAIRASVTKNHGLEVRTVVLLKPHSLPRTSSGKTQHFACRNKFLAGEFYAVAISERPSLDRPFESGLRVYERDGGRASEDEIQSWLIAQIAERLEIDPRDIDFDDPFERYGFDSATTISLSGQLENYLGRKLPSTLLYDYPTIGVVSRHLATDDHDRHTASSMDHSQVSRQEPIAVIGMGLRFPGDAHDAESFWRLLREGVDAIDEVPRERWNMDDYFDSRPETKGKMYTRWGGFLKDIDQFDASFFSISAREADSLDPQQRLLLEVNWDALANAGIAPGDLRQSKSAVFIGASTFDYSIAAVYSGDPTTINTYSCTGNSGSTLSGRISYLLDLRGPSVTIDTACSSSLVAIHLACRSLLSGESNLALAGGVNLMVLPEIAIGFSQARMLSADGRCKTFDAAADGFARGEGCGVVVLKRLRDALADNDNILALIRGSSINHDGRSNGLTVPNGPAQTELIREALARAGVNPTEVDYVEAHGTGTAVGDPIELRALAGVFAQRPLAQPLLLGSVKTNLGHLEAAAGIASLIKVVLALGHGEIPPHLHLRQLTPHVPWNEWPMQVPTTLTPWPTHDSGRRLAGVSSFGISGTNAHLVVENFQPPALAAADSAAPAQACHLLPLSAKSETALRQMAARFAQHLEDHPQQELAAICYTSGAGRSHYRHRLAVVGHTHAELSNQLRLFAAGGAPTPSLVCGSVPAPLKQASAFSGAGSQFPGTGRRDGDEWDQFLLSVATLYVNGGQPNWLHLLPGPPPRKVALPTYAFQHQRYWVKSPTRTYNYTAPHTPQRQLHPLLGDRLRSPKISDVIYEASLGAAQTAYLADHRVDGEALMPAAAYLEMALASANVADGGPYALKDVEFREPLILPANTSQTVQLALTSIEGHRRFEIYSLDREEETERWTLHASGNLIAQQAQPNSISLDDLRRRLPEQMSPVACYEQFSVHGLDYGPGFRTIKEFRCNAEEALGEIALPESLVSEAGSYNLHPALLDGCFQLLGGILLRARKDIQPQEVYLPIGVGQLRYYANSNTRLWAYVKLRTAVSQNSTASLTANVHLLNANGETLAEIYGLRLLRTRSGRRLEVLEEADSELLDSLHQVEWQRQPIPDQDQIHLPPDYLPTPPRLKPELELLTTRLREEYSLDTGAELLPLVDSLSRDYALQALDHLGWHWRTGEHVSAAVIAKALGVIEPHHRLLGRFLEMLEEDGFLQRVTNGPESQWVVIKVPGPGKPQDDWESLVNRLPAIKFELTLLRECGEQLSDVLSGKLDPLQLLFPSGSMSKLTQIYETAPVARAMNQLMAQAFEKGLAELPSGRTVRVLEVGAGTGGTSSYLLKTVPQGQTRYTFTDISPRFTTAAARRFSDFDFVEYRLLDIERDPGSQGFRSEDYDILVAANVLHAAADVRQSLRNMRQLLAPGGLMFLLESTRRNRLLDLTFGLTEGWWRFADPELRPRYPLLEASEWIRITNAEGFTDSVAVPDGHEQPLISPETLIISRSAERVLAHTPVEKVSTRDAQLGQWLVIADHRGVGESLAEALRRRGETCVLARPDTKEDYESILKDALNGERNRRGIVHLLNLDSTRGVESDGLELDELQTEIDRGCRSLLLLSQAIAETGIRAPLWIVTRSAQGIARDTKGVSVGQAAVQGLRNVVALEHPELACTTVDLDEDRAGSAHEIEVLLAEISSQSREDHVAYRDGDRYVARLVQSQSLDLTSVQLAISSRGVLDNLFLQPLRRRKPGPGEIEIQVFAAGINFRDVLNAMGVYEGAGALGSECVGRVVALGEGVTDFVLGDDVIALVEGSFCSFVTVPTSFAVRKPPQLSYEEAATIATPFLTAFHGLCNLAQISAGDRVLIHNAAGGVGQAAVQIALQAGAEIYATASPGKWEFLRSQGVKHIANSRSLDFAERVLEWTNGQGVDIVLNSLPGEFIAASLTTLKPTGHFLEIGKRDIWTTAQVAEVKPSASYSIYDLGQVASSEPELFRSTFETIMSQVEQGKLQPLRSTAFPIADAVEAFRFMAAAKHIGRVVLLLNDHEKRRSPRADVSLRSDASYLITGGLGGLGLLVARWLVERGARQLILVGRNEPSEAALKTIGELEAVGARVSALKGDVSQQHDVEKFLRDIESDHSPLRGIIHAAGVLDDGLLRNLRWEQFRTVMDPKVRGAWNLHRLTRGLQLDFFIMFSSAASMLGSPGQGNHASANAFLDALAHHRRSLGLPGLSINWGPWSEVGAAAKLYVERSAPNAIRSISPSEGLRTLAQVWNLDSPQVGIFRVQWEDLVKQFAIHETSPFLSELVARQQTTDEPRPEFLKTLDAAPENERYDLLLEHVRQLVAETLDWRDPEPPDPQQGFFDLGMDSLTSLELSNRLQASLGKELPSTMIFDAPNIETLTRSLAADVLGLSNENQSKDHDRPETHIGAQGLLENIQHLSDDEVDRILAGKGISEGH